jgi:hypothetical protein
VFDLIRVREIKRTWTVQEEMRTHLAYGEEDLTFFDVGRALIAARQKTSSGSDIRMWWTLKYSPHK